MVGNVFEFTSSRLNAGERVVRGGGYYYLAIAQRSTNRNTFDSAFRDPGVGFRVCATAPSAGSP
jgi:formylglycine-generating enzyme required for sulfatase activity